MFGFFFPPPVPSSLPPSLSRASNVLNHGNFLMDNKNFLKEFFLNYKSKKLENMKITPWFLDLELTAVNCQVLLCVCVHMGMHAGFVHSMYMVL